MTSANQHYAWCQALQIATPEALSEKAACDVLSAQHPYIQWLQQQGYMKPGTSPTGLKTSDA